MVVWFAVEVSNLCDPSTRPGGEFRPPNPSASPDILARMVKEDLVRAVMAQADVSRRTAASAVDAIFNRMRVALVRHERIELRGFAVFEVRKRRAGVGRNPKTLVVIPIPRGHVVRFKPGQTLRSL